jgi:hypothetical protein
MRFWLRIVRLGMPLVLCVCNAQAQLPLSALVKWSGDAKTGALRLSRMADSVRGKGQDGAADTLGSWAIVYRADAALQEHKFTRAERLLEYAAATARTERGLAIIGNEAVRLAASIAGVDTTLADRFEAIAEAAQPVTLGDYTVRALYRSRELKYRGKPDSAKALLAFALNGLEQLHPVSAPGYSQHTRSLLTLALVDLASLIDPRQPHGVDSVRKLLAKATAVAAPGDVAGLAAIHALRADLFGTQGDQKRADQQVRLSISTLATSGVGSLWYSPSPEAGLNGTLSPLRLQSLLANYGDVALRAGDTAGAISMFDAQSSLSYLGASDAPYIGALLVPRVWEGSARTAEAVLRYALQDGAQQIGGDRKSLIRAWLMVSGGLHPFDAVDVTGSSAMPSPWRSHSIIFLCLSLQEEQWPDYLREECKENREQLHEDTTKGKSSLDILSKRFLPPPLVHALMTLPRGAVLHLVIPPAFLIVPFSALPFGDGRLGNYFTLLYCVPRPERKLRDGGGGSVVVVKGTPTIGAQVDYGTKVDTVPVQGDLDQDAVSQALWVADTLHADRVRDAGVKEPALYRVLQRYSTIHITTHGSFSPKSGQGFLAVEEDPNDAGDQSPGALTADEIMEHVPQMREDAVVTLAACESAIAPPMGEFYRSVGGAFIWVGARAVVGALWKVKTSSVRTFMKAFYSRRLARDDEATSFRYAVQALLATDSQDWAGFVLMTAQCGLSTGS